ncbi:uncharacterized protein BT62DRAFT_1080432 [Guyanagaster necrorhizus]|uniref:Uncharacterized protein n=1 Tax=Guyanagaster necrorhizus TaxID=856835 RepID=A0A9P7VI74_9AGAR|nr:uncharacterized protein BT62DRAFT_1080432 [Guyanagaster necrorhizus MCA 3950]KAG7441077.1 hypothetical protein BT62DRAFT_1080432 [Guyanagaster necrorhizus MCA 3950]
MLNKYTVLSYLSSLRRAFRSSGPITPSERRARISSKPRQPLPPEKALLLTDLRCGLVGAPMAEHRISPLRSRSGEGGEDIFDGGPSQQSGDSVPVDANTPAMINCEWQERINMTRVLNRTHKKNDSRRRSHLDYYYLFVIFFDPLYPYIDCPSLRLTERPSDGYASSISPGSCTDQPGALRNRCRMPRRRLQQHLYWQPQFLSSFLLGMLTMTSYRTRTRLEADSSFGSTLSVNLVTATELTSDDNATPLVLIPESVRAPTIPGSRPGGSAVRARYDGLQAMLAVSNCMAKIKIE